MAAIQRMLAGFRLPDGGLINQIIDVVNNITGNGTPQALTGTSLNLSTGPIQFGSTATAALLEGAGTAASPYAMGTTANQNLLGFWGTSTATTGDSRAAYLRMYFSGVGGSGEALRAFGTVNNVTAATGGTVNGAHVSLSVSGASGAVSGAGNALRATLGLGASTNPGGTLAVIQVDTDLDNAATVPASAAYIALTNSNTKSLGYLLRSTTTNTTMYQNAGTSAGSAGDADNCAAQKVLKISIDGADCYIPVFTQNS